jgi:hypothetical protein
MPNVEATGQKKNISIPHSIFDILFLSHGPNPLQILRLKHELQNPGLAQRSR